MPSAAWLAVYPAGVWPRPEVAEPERSPPSRRGEAIANGTFQLRILSQGGNQDPRITKVFLNFSISGSPFAYPDVYIL